jgi:peptidoglycan-associated lipoprotein
MIFKTRKPLAALAMALSLGLIACSEDEKPAQEVVQPTTTEQPATPPETPAPSTAEVTQPIYFAFDDYSLSGDAQSQLNKLGDFLKGGTTTVVQVEGHCDERGSVEYNLALGQRRAQSAKNYLVQLGVDPSRVPTMSYGEEKPAVDGQDESAWAKNRRAEFVVTTP